jgi:hypothetical protein
MSGESHPTSLRQISRQLGWGDRRSLQNPKALRTSPDQDTSCTSYSLECATIFHNQGAGRQQLTDDLDPARGNFVSFRPIMLSRT